MSDMAAFRIDIEIENPALPGRRGGLSFVLVGTGSELSWAPSPILESLGIKPSQSLAVSTSEWLHPKTMEERCRAI